MNTSAHRYSRGYMLLLALVVSSIVMAVTVGFLNYFSSAIRAERFALASTQALSIAEAGIDLAIYELNQNAGYAGVSDTALGEGVFNIEVSSIDGNTKQITVTSYVPNSTNPTATKVVKAAVNIDTSIVAFRYGVQIGQGGVTMNNGSVIEGNLFANGNVSGSGTITGDTTVAVGVASTPDQSWAVQDSGFNVGDTAARANVAQSFRPSISTSLTRLSLNLKKTGTPGDISIRIVADNSGEPSTTVLATGSVQASLITGAYGFVDVTLGSTPTLVANQTYWVIAIAPVSASDYFTWGLDTAAGYSNGAAKFSTSWNPSPIWSAVTGDLDFKMYASGTATTLTGITVQGDVWAHTISSCSVGGDAKYQTISGCSVTGTKYPGTDPAPPVPFAISDAQILEWETIAESGGVIAGPYTITGAQTLGPKKINGDLTIDINAILTLSGPLWVNGNVLFKNNSTLTVSPSTGNSGAIIIADAVGNTATKGIVDLSNNTAISGNGTANSFPMVISTNTGSSAVSLANNADSVILYAPYGTVEVSNNAGANQITAKLLRLLNNATISYVSGLQNTSFSNGPGGSWTVIPGTYAIIR